MNVFIGLTNIASQIEDYERGFRNNGCETLTAVHSVQSATTKGKFDYAIEAQIPPILRRSNAVPARGIKKIYRRLLTRRVWKEAISKCDLFVFLWSSFRFDFSDYELLKKLGKKIVTIHVGDDVRWKPAMEQEFAQYNIPPIEYLNYYRPGNDLRSKLLCLRKAERFSDVLLSQPNQAQLALRPYHHFIFPIDLSKFQGNRPQRRYRPVVVHAPTSREAKGSKHILAACGRLREEGMDFDLRLLENVPNSEVIRLYADADILVDQLLCPGGGKVAREGLACGAVVVSNVTPQYFMNEPSECPIVDANPATFYDVLKDLLLDYPRRVTLAKQGRPYVEEYHDVNKLCERILELAQKPLAAPDFVPTFFRNEFVPESAEAISLCNDWTGYVRDCAWYRQYISPGEREGLIF